MADDGKGSWGGKREGAGSGGVREGAGRPKNAHDVVLSPSRIVSVGQKWKFAEKFLQYAEEMLDRMVDLARNAQSEAVRLAAQNSIIDRALGKAPQHIDVSAVHHTEIVYRSAEQIRQELLERGVPQVLLDYTRLNRMMMKKTRQATGKIANHDGSLRLSQGGAARDLD